MDKIIEDVFTGLRAITATIRERPTGERYLYIQGPFNRYVKIEKSQINQIHEIINKNA